MVLPPFDPVMVIFLFGRSLPFMSFKYALTLLVLHPPMNVVVIIKEYPTRVGIFLLSSIEVWAEDFLKFLFAEGDFDFNAFGI